MHMINDRVRDWETEIYKTQVHENILSCLADVFKVLVGFNKVKSLHLSLDMILSLFVPFLYFSITLNIVSSSYEVTEEIYLILPLSLTKSDG